MPTLKVTTKSAEKVWASPDGKMVISKVVFDYNGQSLEAKTYSNAIAVPGWVGEVESYEKQGKMGSETFVKQPQKEQGAYGGGSYKGGGASRPMTDPFTMYLSYAKDLVVALVNTTGFDESQLKTLLDATVDAGKFLYEARPGADSAEAKPAQEELPIIDVDAPIDLSEVDKMFPPAEGEKPWPKS